MHVFLPAQPRSPATLSAPVRGAHAHGGGTSASRLGIPARPAHLRGIPVTANTQPTPTRPVHAHLHIPPVHTHA
jgi:hypothetical protein